MPYLIDKISHHPILATSPDDHVIQMIPGATALGLQVLPLCVEHDALLVAMAEPVDWDRLQQLRLMTGYRIQAVMVESSWLHPHLSAAYPVQPAGQAVLDTNASLPVADSTHDSERLSQPEPMPDTAEAPIIRMVDEKEHTLDCNII